MITSIEETLARFINENKAARDEVNAVHSRVASSYANGDITSGIDAANEYIRAQSSPASEETGSTTVESGVTDGDSGAPTNAVPREGTTEESSSRREGSTEASVGS